MGSIVALRSVPKAENRTVEDGGRSVPSRKGKRHVHVRVREHLTPHEVDKLITVAKRNRWGQRDATAILLAYRHGLRVSELCDLQWTQVDFNGWWRSPMERRPIPRRRASRRWRSSLPACARPAAGGGAADSADEGDRQARRRPDPFAAVTVELREWFEAEPWRTSRELLERCKDSSRGLIRTASCGHCSAG